MEANASRYHGKAPDELDWTDAQRQKRAVAEYQAGLEAETRDQERKDNRGGGSDATPTAASDRKPPKVISPSDPSSAWTAKANKRVQFGYGLNYLIDVEHAIIVDVEATPARTYDEVASTRTVIERTEQRLDLKPDWLVIRPAILSPEFASRLTGHHQALMAEALEQSVETISCRPCFVAKRQMTVFRRKLGHELSDRRLRGRELPEIPHLAATAAIGNSNRITQF
jgi:hypothetical protein